MYVKLMSTLLREVESAVPKECFSGYICSVLVILYIINMMINIYRLL